MTTIFNHSNDQGDAIRVDYDDEDTTNIKPYRVRVDSAGERAVSIKLGHAEWQQMVQAGVAAAQQPGLET